MTGQAEPLAGQHPAPNSLLQGLCGAGQGSLEAANALPGFLTAPQAAPAVPRPQRSHPSWPIPQRQPQVL